MGMRLPPDVEARCLALASQRPEAAAVRTFASEEQFQAWVIEQAKAHGWRHYHTRNSRKSVAGFFDLVLVRERVLWVELKLEGKSPDAAQLNWIEDVAATGGEVYVWRPSDLVEILSVLAERRRTWREWTIEMGDRMLAMSGALSRAAERRTPIGVTLEHRTELRRSADGTR